MVISSSSVPNKAWLYRGEYKIPAKVANNHREQLDKMNEDGVESDVEVDSETDDSEETV